MHYLPASLLPWPLGCIQRLLPCKRCRVGPCCTSPKPTQSVRSPLRDWHEPRLAYLQQPESRARTTQRTCRSMMLSTSFKCSPMRVPLRRCISLATRARHSAREPLGPSSASSAPAAGRSPRPWRGRPAPPPGPRPGLRPSSARTSARKDFDALVHRVPPPYRLSA